MLLLLQGKTIKHITLNRGTVYTVSPATAGPFFPLFHFVVIFKNSFLHKLD